LLRVGETRSLPVIRAAKQAAPPAEWVLLDAPPGTSCPAVETVRGCDFVLLVTEPTPFGLHDLRLAVDVAKTLKLACGVVINRALVGQTETRQFCQQTRIPVLGEIPDSMAVAEACSEGQLAVEAVPGLRRTFAQLLLRFAFLSSTSALPEAVRRNLKEFAEPGGEPSSTMSRTLKASSPAVCYLALKKRSQPETASRASPSPEK
jgi:MinD-like ATPase involved in chromosome partitioning or flagellar assembly